MVSGITWIGSGSTAISVGSDFTASIVDISSTEGLSALGLSAGLLEQITTVNAAGFSNALTINGNTLDNVLIGGDGADTLTGNAGADTFAYDGKGNDVITDYVAGADVISLGSASYTGALDGDNYVFNFSGSSLTVQNVFGEILTVNVDGNVSSIAALPEGLSYDDNATKTGLVAKASFSGDIAIGSYSSSVLNIDASAATNAVSLNGNDSANSLIGGSGNDYLWGGSGNDTLTGNAGNDTFVFSAGKDVITAYESGDTISLEAAYSTAGIVDGNYVFNFSDSANVLTVGGVSLGDQLVVYNGTSTATTITALDMGLSLADNALTASSLFSGGAINLAGNSAVFGDVVTVNAAAVTNDLAITGNAKDNVLIGGTSGNYLAGGEGSDSLTGGAGKDTYFYNAGNDVITDYASDDVIFLNSAYAAAGLSDGKYIFKFNDGSLTVNGISAIGDQLVVYNGTSTATTITALDMGLTLADNALTASSLFAGNAIDLAGNSAVFGSVTTVNAAALTSAVSITGNGNNNYLIGGSGADYLIGGAGNDSLTGNAGKDTFVYSAGNDVITDYVAGEDVLSFGSLSYSGLSAVGDNAVFTFDSGSLIVNGAASAVMTLSDGSTVSITAAETDTMPAGLNYNENKTALVADSVFAGGVIDLAGYSTTVATVNAAAVAGAVSIVGNDLDNSLVGGAGADYLSGGKGSDSLTGGAGNDIFVYDGAGNDVITDYASGDKISFSAAYTAAGLSGNDYVFNFSDSSSLTVNNVALGDELSVVNASGSDLTITALPLGLSFNSSKNGLIADTLFAGSEIDLTDYSNKVRSIDASALSSAINLIGNNYTNTLIGGTGADTFTGGNGNDFFVYASGADVITDYASGDRISLGGASIVDVTVDGSNLVLDFGNDNTLALTGAAKKKIQFREGSKMTYNYFGNHAIIDGTNTKATLTATATGFNAADFSKLLDIDAAGVSTAINITGNSKANKIYASNNGASITGGKGNDTLFGGSGVDLFVYARGDGNDVISNYAAGEVISLTSGTLADASLKSNGDAVLKVGSGIITVKSAASTEITISENGTAKYFADGVLYNADKTTATLPAKYSSSSAKTFDATVTTIDASDVKKRINLTASATTGATMTGGKNKDSLTGGTGADYIDGANGNDYLIGGAGADSLIGGKGKDSLYGGADADFLTGDSGNDRLYGEEGNDNLYGGAGRDTLYGGAGADSLYGGAGNDKIYGEAGNDYIVGSRGNDTMWGGDGADTFFYMRGDGKDVIVGFSNEDTLTFDNLDLTSATVNARKNEIYLQVGSTKKAITLKDSTADEFNINGDTYTISGNTLVKK